MLALFDLNGVLIDSEPINKKIWKIMCEKHNIAFTENFYSLNIDGKKSEHVADSVFNISDYTSFLNEKDAIWNTIMETYSIPIFDDAIRFLRILKKIGFKCCVVSASRNAGKVVQMSKLNEYIDLVIDGNNIRFGKPNPEIIFKAMNYFKETQMNVVLFEDSINGIEAGIAANVVTIGIRCISIVAKNKCYKNINTFDELQPNELLHILKANSIKP